MGGQGDKRRLRRQRRLGKKDAEKAGNSPAFIAVALLVAGVQLGGVLQEPLAAGLSELYCTPEYCLTLPQALTGWALAVVPLLVYLWHLQATIYVSALLVGLMATVYLIAPDGLLALPTAFFLVGMVFVPISVGISRLAEPGWRAVAVAGQHWLLLAGLITWLA